MPRSHRLTRQKLNNDVSKMNQPGNTKVNKKSKIKYKGGDVPTVIKKNDNHSVVASPNRLLGGTGTLFEFGSVPLKLRKYSSASAAVSKVGVGSGFGTNGQLSALSLLMPSLAHSSALERIANPYWISVTPRPAREPSLAACVVWSRYVSKKPTNWNEIETSMFQRKEKREPVGSESTTISPGVFDAEGIFIVVSQ